MSEKDKENNTERANDYKDRARFWTDKSISQLSFSINLTTTVTLAVLGYILNNHKDYNFCWKLEECGVSTKNICYFLSLVFIIWSVFIGFLSNLSRNQDLRMTRHICETRKKYEKNKVKYKKVTYETEENTSEKKDFEENIICLIIEDFHHFDEKQFADSNYKLKFERFREKPQKLGRYTWKFHQLQIWTLFIALVFYTITVICTC